MIELEAGTKFSELKVDTKYQFDQNTHISDTGIKLVRAIINLQADVPKSWVFRVKHGLGGPVWSTKDGNFTKRVARYMFKAYHVKLDPNTIMRIGNVARRNMSMGPMIFDFTRRITWNSGDFGDRGSCYWTDFEQSRGVMMKAGIGAIRIFDSRKRGIGRAWFAPLSSREQFMLFNAYGPLQLTSIANFLSQLFGKEYAYKSIWLNQRQTKYELYINGQGIVIHKRRVNNTLRLTTEGLLDPTGGQRRWVNSNLPKAGEGWFEREDERNEV